MGMTVFSLLVLETLVCVSVTGVLPDSDDALGLSWNPFCQTFFRIFRLYPGHIVSGRSGCVNGCLKTQCGFSCALNICEES